MKCCLATLRRRGAVVLEPASGRLTGADSGAGRLPEAEEITTLAHLLLERTDALPYDLAGVKVLVSAGGTREPLDPVRFIGNRSSGKQGYAVARVAAQRGADVTLIAGHTAGLVDPAGVDVVHIGAAVQLHDAVSKHAPDAHVLVMAAAAVMTLAVAARPSATDVRLSPVRCHSSLTRDRRKTS